MFKYAIIRPVFLIQLCICLIGNFYFGISIWVGVVITILYFALIAYGAFSIQSNFFLTSYSSGNPKDKSIALTFDDGPVAQTENIRKILEAYKIKGTFFIIGKNIKGNEQIVRDLDADGHILGNHTYCHDYFFDFYGTAKVEEDITSTNKILMELIHKKPLLFRPPFGVTNPTIAKVLKRINMHSIGWNIRSFDTMITDKEKLKERVFNQIKPGGIILFHDTGAATVEILKELIPFSIKSGYKIVGIDALLALKVYEEIT